MSSYVDGITQKPEQAASTAVRNDCLAWMNISRIDNVLYEVRQELELVTAGEGLVALKGAEEHLRTARALLERYGAIGATL